MTPTTNLRQRIHDLMPQAQRDLAHMVAIPSVADPRQFPAEKCLEMANFVRDTMTDAGIKDCRLIDMPDGHPIVYGHTPPPPGAPTVLLYCHYDVQPPLDDAAWTSPPFTLTERDGRLYGRGAADCKGNIAMHLTALRTFEGDFPVGITFIAEGAEEQNTGGLESWIPTVPDMVQSDVVLVCDTGNFAVGVPTLTTTLRGIVNVTVNVRTLQGPVHSGMFGGPAPDALVALISVISTLHDRYGNTTIEDLENIQSWTGVDYPEDQFRADAGILPNVSLTGSGNVSEMLWARPSLNVLGIDCPPIVGSSAALQPTASARLSLRVPPGMDAEVARDALIEHLRAVAPWNCEIDIEAEEPGQPFRAQTNGPAYHAMSDAMAESFGREMTTEGQGGSIPLCNVFADTLPDAEIMLLGVEEPQCLIHAPNESVDPNEIEHIAMAEALFLSRCATLAN